MKHSAFARLLARGYTIRTTDRSRGWVLFCCPWHDDRRPSFSFNEESGWGECHSPRCGIKGNLTYLIEQAAGLGITYVPDTTASDTGTWDRPKELVITRRHRAAFKRLMEGYEQTFTSAPEGRVAREYLERRKLNVSDVHALGLRLGCVVSRDFARAWMPADDLPLLDELGLVYDDGADSMYWRLLVFSLQHTWAQGRALAETMTTKYKGTSTPKPIIRTDGQHPFAVCEGWTDAATWVQYGIHGWVLNGNLDPTRLVRLLQPLRENAFDGTDADHAGSKFHKELVPVTAGWGNYHGHKDANECHRKGVAPTLEFR